jgi:PHD/YefM family antitoxin component YafN of YafNO toxin-antitoxin module
MEKLPISIGILSWHSGQVLVDTLTTYYENGLFDMVNDVTILFQEVTPQDMEIARHFGLDFIGLQKNIGIGQAFIRLTENAKKDYVLVLEHDWNLIENSETTYERLQDGTYLLNECPINAVRYRHRKQPGNPHFSFRYQGQELTYYDDNSQCTSPHLLDSLHWCEPDIEFPDKIQKLGQHFTTTSRWGNWTNNPTMYKKDFYLETVRQFAGDGIALEGNIAKWWAEQEFGVAHGEGLFKHNDWQKYGR